MQCANSPEPSTRHKNMCTTFVTSICTVIMITNQELHTHLICKITIMLQPKAAAKCTKLSCNYLLGQYRNDLVILYKITVLCMNYSILICISK